MAIPQLGNLALQNLAVETKEINLNLGLLLYRALLKTLDGVL
jgi:hypothetical protein